MFKKLLFVIAALVATMGIALADVDVNKGDQAALDGIKGIGPAKSKAIIEERTKNGAFKDWADLEKRVKGIGDKNSATFSQGGLTVNGQPKPGVAAPAVASASASAAASSASAKVKAPKASASASAAASKASASK